MIELWTAVAAVAASVSALIAAVAAWLTFRMVREQGEPKVVVYTCADPDRQTLILIRIANIGRDVATDIVFTPSRTIPALALGLSVQSAQPAHEMDEGPLVEGIPVLGPGDARDITWGQVGGLLKALGKAPIDLTITYKHGRRKLKAASRLEVRSFIATDAAAKPAESSARSLKQIAAALAALETERRPQRRQKVQQAEQIKAIPRPAGVEVEEGKQAPPEGPRPEKS
jgi:hypothetical protein